MDRCLNCGHELPSGTSKRVCPRCGVESLGIQASDDIAIGLTAELVVEKRGQGLDGIRFTSDSGRDISAEASQDTVGTSITAPPRPGRCRSGELEVCRKLIERLNQDGGRWGAPELFSELDSDIDCVAFDGQSKLCIQVTRPEFERESIWTTIGSGQPAHMRQTAEAAASEIKAAIDRKAAQTVAAQRKSLVLAIDALETPGLLLDPVPRVFEGSYGDSVRRLGFREIWLVGPTATSTVRLAP